MIWYLTFEGPILTFSCLLLECVMLFDFERGRGRELRWVNRGAVVHGPCAVIGLSAGD